MLKGVANQVGGGQAGVFSSVTDSALTSGRVVIVGTGGLLEDDAGLTYNKTTDALSVGRVLGADGSDGAPTFAFASERNHIVVCRGGNAEIWKRWSPGV